MKPLSRLALAGAIASFSLACAANDASAGDRYRWRPDCASGNAAQPWRAASLNVVGLTADQRLVCFNEHRPQHAVDIGAVSGLYTDTKLVGIDFRVQDGFFYGVGDAGGVYKLDTSNASATLASRLTVALDGTSFGVDFNPAADRLRIVSDRGQNLRHNINAGGVTLLDDPLDYPPATPPNTSGPTALGVAGAAYTNNDLSPDTATTLFVLDSNLDQIAIQSPPNNGTLAATGKLGVDASLRSGFDIHSRLRDGVTVGARAFATLAQADGRSTFYRVSLTTGKATPRGSFAARNQVVDIAVALD